MNFDFSLRGAVLASRRTRLEPPLRFQELLRSALSRLHQSIAHEKRWQFTENLTHIRGGHTYKMGVDFNHLPVKASFPLNQGAVYYFPAALPVDNPLIAAAVTPAVAAAWRSSGAPPFNAAQAYGFGFPESFVQQFGGLERTTSRYENTTLGWFVQDSWKLAQNLTLNYGVRYDTEFTPVVPASSPLSEAGEKLLGVVQGIPRDTNNWAPAPGFCLGSLQEWAQCGEGLLWTFLRPSADWDHFPIRCCRWNAVPLSGRARRSRSRRLVSRTRVYSAGWCGSQSGYRLHWQSAAL